MRTHVGIVPAPTPAVAITQQQRRRLFMACSLLLDYPDEVLIQRIPTVREALGAMPAAIEAELEGFFHATDTHAARWLEEHYVDTFDQRRRCSLFLSYYAVGDTRQRGTAILAFRDALGALGFELDRDELPDHLCVLLEAAGLAQGEVHDQATQILATHRDGIEVLRAALETFDSPYAHLIKAVCMALPEIDQELAQHFMELIRQGPPSELVGLGTPFPFAQTENP
ncbi:nitrate reductase molybdenum cofactor assembly chaperone [Corynebacterium pseudopelargi]|uniref:Nitrate reductase-like protein NarX n=1 Tax=Corynebacterium pseudopelargi TaxID=2080757 RepID=A0A3G6IV87_9CORY|nr:nitrate reductase molybdenum cofactor assembly chaperone [Corynebacterium pseudopelargi]AZA09493.1 Nitrate reductase-like protein NarX [Corynebacterium pseudopelargi]